MSEVKTEKLSPRVTSLQLGDSGDTFTVPSGATLDIASGATITNSGTATGFGGDNTPSFYAYPSSNTAVSASTWTKVSLQSELWDSDSAFDATTNYRFTVPSGEGGKYCFHYGATNTGIDNGEQVSIALYKNGSREDRGYTWEYSPTTNKYINVVASSILELSAADYVELWTYHDETESRSVEAAYTFFAGFKLIGV